MSEPNVFSLKHVVHASDRVPSATVKYCKFDGVRCFSNSCDRVLADGSVVSCRRRRGSRGRFTRAKSGVDF